VIEALLQAERLLLHGQVDQAETIYRNAAAQDPNNAIAVVGLARVALERGDEQAAYDRARDALAIDPQNAAAQRLEARLAEVFATRADPSLPAPEPDERREDRPSERAFLTRNPSMADHLAADERRATPDASPTDPRQPEETQTEPKPGLWRRILGE
jgi:thioredoxin-like negative regulator of GroEL